MPFLPFVAGLLAGAVTVKLLRGEQARGGLKLIQNALQTTTGSRVAEAEQSSGAPKQRKATEKKSAPARKRNAPETEQAATRKKAVSKPAGGRTRKASMATPVAAS